MFKLSLAGLQKFDVFLKHPSEILIQKLDSKSFQFRHLFRVRLTLTKSWSKLNFLIYSICQR